MGFLGKLCILLVGGWLLLNGLGLATGIIISLGPRGDDGAWFFTVAGLAFYIIPALMAAYVIGCTFWLGKHFK